MTFLVRQNEFLVRQKDRAFINICIVGNIKHSMFRIWKSTFSFVHMLVTQLVTNTLNGALT
jgi:hypothetical protein